VARRKKMLVRRKLLSPRSFLVEESRASVAVTVAWMLTLLITGIALVLAGIIFLVTQTVPLSPIASRNLASLEGLLTITAAITGLLCLVLTVVVYRVRQTPPPISITVAAVIAGILPMALLFLLS
jgi:hypothetical protein